MEMDMGVINAFLSAVDETFSTMLGAKVTRGALEFMDKDHMNENSITATIGISGSPRMTVLFSLKEEVAIKIASRLLETELAEVNDDVMDAVCELSNIISGSAKAKIPGTETNPLQLGLPSIIRGEKYRVELPSKAKHVSIPFASDFGNFNVGLGLMLQ